MSSPERDVLASWLLCEHRYDENDLSDQCSFESGAAGCPIASPNAEDSKTDADNGRHKRPISRDIAEISCIASYMDAIAVYAVFPLRGPEKAARQVLSGAA